MNFLEKLDLSYIKRYRYPVFMFPKHRHLFPYHLKFNIPYIFILLAILKPSKIVEVGIDEGGTYFSFCQFIKKFRVKCKCLAITDYKESCYDEKLAKEAFEKIQKTNCEYEDFSQVFKVTSNEAIQNDSYPDFSDIDLLHINSVDVFKSTRESFDEWYNQLSDRAVVLVSHLYSDNNRRCFNKIKKGRYSLRWDNKNGMGTIIVGKELNEELVGFFKNSSHCEEIFKIIGMTL